ncbi:MAG: hypothetical protein HQK81_09430 [Desulfovibrionaceae bacterium]|nr:hypothetical protein [Desulfovibrionaceae bacterium]MBF0514261.1 hypothetical protein [Desulfovibrionaceae bacterium]
MRKIIVILALAAAIMAPAGLASAQSYAQGSFAVTPSVGYYGLLEKHTTSLFTYGADFGYFVMDGLEIGLRAQGAYLTMQFNDLAGSTNYSPFNGGGGEGYLRWHFYQFNNNAGSIFAEVGAGAMWFAINGGQRFHYLSDNGQFSGIAGLGLKYALGQSSSIMLSANYRHIGSFDHHSIDGLGGALGLQFTF